MKVKSVVTGLTVAAVAGTLAYGMSTASAREKRTLKNKTGRALYAIVDVMEVVSAMLR